jgi:hypothetical protein
VCVLAVLDFPAAPGAKDPSAAAAFVFLPAPKLEYNIQAEYFSKKKKTLYICP